MPSVPQSGTNSPERRHIAGLDCPEPVSRQHAGAPAPRVCNIQASACWGVFDRKSARSEAPPYLGDVGRVRSFGKAKQGSSAPHVLHSRQRMQPETLTCWSTFTPIEQRLRQRLHSVHSLGL